MRRKFKRGRYIRGCKKKIREEHIYLRGYEEVIREEQVPQSLREGNSRGADFSEFMRRKFERCIFLRDCEKEI
jgi:hypothetical protein